MARDRVLVLREGEWDALAHLARHWLAGASAVWGERHPDVTELASKVIAAHGTPQRERSGQERSDGPAPIQESERSE